MGFTVSAIELELMSFISCVFVCMRFLMYLVLLHVFGSTSLTVHLTACLVSPDAYVCVSAFHERLRVKSKAASSWIEATHEGSSLFHL